MTDEDLAVIRARSATRVVTIGPGTDAETAQLLIEAMQDRAVLLAEVERLRGDMNIETVRKFARALLAAAWPDATSN